MKLLRHLVFFGFGFFAIHFNLVFAHDSFHSQEQPKRGGVDAALSEIQLMRDFLSPGYKCSEEPRLRGKVCVSGKSSWVAFVFPMSSPENAAKFEGISDPLRFIYSNIPVVGQEVCRARLGDSLPQDQKADFDGVRSFGLQLNVGLFFECVVNSASIDSEPESQEHHQNDSRHENPFSNDPEDLAPKEQESSETKT